MSLKLLRVTIYKNNCQLLSLLVHTRPVESLHGLVLSDEKSMSIFFFIFDCFNSVYKYKHAPAINAISAGKIPCFQCIGSVLMCGFIHFNVFIFDMFIRKWKKSDESTIPMIIIAPCEHIL